MKYFFLFFSLVFTEIIVAQADRKATKFTKNLYRNLQAHKGNGMLFGQQDALAYGLNGDGTNWLFESNRSDIKSVTGEHPAVAGWDLGKIEFDSLKNIDGVPFDLMRERIIEHFQRGGISTISWHPNNPTNPQKTSWDKADSTIRNINRNKAYSATYYSWLKKVAVFLKSLKDPATGKPIPVIFRPWHEHTGSWFWWGAGHCTVEEYKQFWRDTFKCLTKKYKVHNALFAYSTDKFTSPTHYLERYPGDDVIDLVGFDIYHRGAPKSNEAFINDTRKMVNWLKEIGDTKNKITAITETGLESVTEANWWTNILAPIIKDSNLTYTLIWRNSTTKHFYGPYPSQKSETDFKKFIIDSNIFLEKKTGDLKLYDKN